MSARPRPRKMGHLVLMVRDIHKSAKFYSEIVGLEVSDWIEDQMVFLRCGADHHDLALAQLPKDAEHFDKMYNPFSRPGTEHFAYELGSLAEVEAAARFLKDKGVDIVRGIGKHGPGENVFLVFRDPDGNHVEFYCDMVQIARDQPHQAKVHPNTIEAFDQWQFKRFVVPPPDWGPRK